MNHRLLLSAFLFLLLPSVLLLPWLLDNPAATPAADYWTVFGNLIDGNNLTLRPGAWFERNNEHLIVVSKAFYLANYVMFSGHSLGLSLMAVVLAGLCGVVLLRLLPPPITTNWFTLAVATAMISLLIFTPRAAELWFFGSNGIDWFLANLLFLTGILALRRAARETSLFWFSLAVTASILAAFTFGIGLLAAPLVFVYGIWLRLPWRWNGTFLLLIVVILGSAAFNYQRPAHHPAVSLDLRLVASFVGTLLGRIVPRGGGGLPLQTAVGFASLTVLMVAGYAALGSNRRQQEMLAPWVLITLYGVGNAVLIGISRAGFGLEQSLATRYAGIAMLFSISVLIVLLLFAATDLTRVRRLFWGALFLLFGVPTSTGAIATFEAEEFLTHSHFRRVMDLGFAMGIEDGHITKYTGANAMFRGYQRAIRNIEHAPYGFPPSCVTGFGRSITLAPGNQPTGGVDKTITEHADARPAHAQLTGWVTRGGPELKCIVVLDRGRRVVGFGLPGFLRPDDGWRPGIKTKRTGWVAIAKPIGADRLQVAAQFEGGAAWHLLPGCFIASNSAASYSYAPSCK